MAKLFKLITITTLLVFSTADTLARTMDNAMVAQLPSTARLYFYDPSHFSQVRLIHDTVMGGRSNGDIKLQETPPGLVFRGNLSLLNNGGFASIELALTKRLSHKKFNSIYLHALADGKRYQLRLKTPFIPNGVAYVASIETTTSTQRYYVPISAFTGQFRGRRVANLPALNFADVSHISVMLADKQEGDFAITLYDIDFTELNSI